MLALLSLLNTIMEPQKLEKLLFFIKGNSDERAFRQLFDYLYPSLLKFAEQITKDPGQSEEVVMDVFMKFWQGRAKMPLIENVKSYFFRAVKNQALTFLRLQSSNRHLSLEDVSVDFRITDLAPDERYISQEEVIRIQQSIDKLPSRCRMVLMLVKEQQMSYRQAAELMNINEKTVENQLAIALKKIASDLHLDTEIRSNHQHKSILTILFFKSFGGLGVFSRL